MEPRPACRKRSTDDAGDAAGAAAPAGRGPNRVSQRAKVAGVEAVHLDDAPDLGERLFLGGRRHAYWLF